MKSKVFRFKQFEIKHDKSAMKVGTDGVLLGAWADVSQCDRILDIGCGTGLIALMLAQRNLQANIDSVEIEKNAYKEAVVNFQNSLWSARLSAINADIKSFSNNISYDLIVSNPPFFTAGTQSPLDQRNKARHAENLNAVDLISISIKLLTDDGKACFIVPQKEGDGLIMEAENQGLYMTRKTLFRPKSSKNIERYLLQFEKKLNPLEQSELIHYNEDGSWSTGYIKLTKDFHPML